MLQLPEMYFEVTSVWYRKPGSLSTWQGCRILELHTLWFEVIAHWWYSSKVDGREYFPYTFNVIDKSEKNH